MQFGITKNSPKWALGLQLLLLVLCFVLSQRTMALAPSQTVPDFTLPSAFQDYAQRLAEQRGNPVLILMLKRCDNCADQLLNLQLLAGRYSGNDLVTWVVWTPHKNDLPPRLNLPVLKYDAQSAATFVMPKDLPAVYLIDRDGKLNHQLSGSYKKLEQQLIPLLDSWLHSDLLQAQE